MVAVRIQAEAFAVRLDSNHIFLIATGLVCQLSYLELAQKNQIILHIKHFKKCLMTGKNIPVLKVESAKD